MTGVQHGATLILHHEVQNPRASVIGAAGSTLVLLHQVHLLPHRFIRFIRTKITPSGGEDKGISQSAKDYLHLRLIEVFSAGSPCNYFPFVG